MFLSLFDIGLHTRVNSSNLNSLSGNNRNSDEVEMTAETCPSVPPSTAVPDSVDMLKLCGDNQNLQQPVQNNTSDDVFSQQYCYNQEYANMEAWLDEHPDFAHDYFIRYLSALINSFFFSNSLPVLCVYVYMFIYSSCNCLKMSESFFFWHKFSSSFVFSKHKVKSIFCWLGELLIGIPYIKF